MINDIAASIRARLLDMAKADNISFNNVLIRFGLERFLYRLSQSDQANQFLLKGAQLFTLWYGMPHRATRDVDLLGFIPSDFDTIKSIFCDIVSISVNDGIIFDTNNVQVSEIRKSSGYSGARVILAAELAQARFKIQVDIGFGDAVTPSAIKSNYPTLLPDLPAPTLRTYPIYTVIAEKIHAITILGMTNSRLKDYFDLFVLINKSELDINIIEKAIKATFARRKTDIPLEFPLGLTTIFANDPSRQQLWQTFLKKNDIKMISLEKVVTTIAGFLAPVFGESNVSNIRSV